MPRPGQQGNATCEKQWAYEKTKGIEFAEGIRQTGADKFEVFYGGADGVVGVVEVNVSIRS